MSCTVEERRRVRRAARAIRDEVATESVDVLAPSASQYGAWTLDAVFGTVRVCHRKCSGSWRSLG
jgi:hypothetical protein